ncbi:caspase family protein [Methylobacterium sp. Leaf87]|uniref:caspase family protein n=1 Tax=Methylobacterium sp. Leaf87 TaxID=1736243 RepID=UPI000A762DED|nr:caspase family protein [Methylobacterium sp. Leaf87]
MRRVCVTIGVSRAEGLSPLRAAVTAAEEIGQWAVISGFADAKDVAVLTDRKDPVTIERVCETLERLLPMGTQTDCLLLHFAGHGLREDSTRTLWLPTNWRTKLRAIAVERLKNRLSDYGIANVTIISDACKALANNKDSSDLTPDGVLGSGISAGSRPIFDRFDAVHDIESAFMIPGSTPEKSRCIFSGALIEALWGATGATDPQFPGQVTAGSLADYLAARVADLCTTYQVRCTPETLPGRPPNHLIYFDTTRVDPAVIPTLPTWPAPIRTAGASQITTDQQPEEKDAFDVDPTVSVDSKFWEGSEERAIIIRDILGDEFGSTNPEITGFEQHLGIPAVAKRQLNDWTRAIAQTPIEGSAAPSKTQLLWLRAQARGAVEGAAVAERKAARRQSTKRLFRLKDLRSPIGGNLLLTGVAPEAIWSQAPINHLGYNRWRVACSAGARQLIVEYEDGVFVPVVVYSALMTIAARDDRGTVGWLFHDGQEGRDNRRAVDILVRLQAGELLPSQVDEVTALLRQSKHGNPVLGAICAYLYDYAGDLDSIRRMAFFYVSRGQPIPFDIALMGELRISRDDDGGYNVAQAAAVQARACAERHARLPDFVSRATPEATGPVAGSCPWLRQGWDFIDAPSDLEAALVQGLPDIRRHLLPETFTSFDREGGMILAEHWGMERYR